MAAARASSSVQRPSKRTPTRAARKPSRSPSPRKKGATPVRSSRGKQERGVVSSVSSKVPRVDGRSFKIAKTLAIWIIVFFVTLVGIDYGVQYLNNQASVAIVNGERIYRKAFYEKLKDTYGTTIATQMIDEALIYQEAEKENIAITDKEIDAEIKTLEDTYGGKEALQGELDSRNISTDKLRSQIETTLIVEQILMKDITITEDEKKEFYEQYKDVLFTDNDNPTYEESEAKIEDTLKDQKISQQVQTWLTDLEGKSTIKNNVEDPKDYSFLGITRAFADQLLGN